MSGFIGDLISGTLSDSTTSALIKGAATIGGALLTNSANSDAANTAAAAKTQAAGITSDAALQAAKITADANSQALDKYIGFSQQGRDELNAAKAAGLGAIDTGTGQYQSTISPLLAPNPILLPTDRGLTPQQQTGEADLMRNARATMAASGLLGAGRAGASAVLDQDRRYQEDARSQNDADTRAEMRRAQGVSNNARSGLASIQASAGGAKANTEIGTGNQLAANLSNVGNVASNLTQSTGAAQAGAVNTAGGAQSSAVDQSGTLQASSNLASAKTDSSALGTLGSILAGNSGVAGSKPTALAGNDPYGDGGAGKGSV